MPNKWCVCVCVNAHSDLSNSLQLDGLYFYSLLYSWNSPERILEQVVISFSRESPQCRVQTHISCISGIGRQLLHHCTTWQPIPILCIYLYARVCIKLEISGFICTATFSICYLFSFLANFLAFRLKSNRLGKTRDQFKKIRDAKRIFHAKMGTTRIKMVWT